MADLVNHLDFGGGFFLEMATENMQAEPNHHHQLRRSHLNFGGPK